MPKLKSELFGDLALKEPEAKQFTVADPQDVTVTPFIEKSELFGGKRGPEPAGFTESALRDLRYKVPIMGPVIEAMELLQIKEASKRLQNPDTDWEKVAESRRRRAWTATTMVGTPTAIPSLMKDKDITAAEAREHDRQLVENYFKTLQERQKRGVTWGGRVGQIVSEMPAWAVDFAMTGPVKRAVSTPVKRFLRQSLKSKILSSLAGWTAGTAARVTAMPHRVFATTMERRLKRGEDWATAFAKGWGSTFIEAGTEEAGKLFNAKTLTKLPFTGKYIAALGNAWQKLSPKNTATKFAEKIMTKAGYNGIIGELGEERLATILHGLAKTEQYTQDPNATAIDNLLAGIKQDLTLSNLSAEAVAFGAFPGAKMATGLAQEGLAAGARWGMKKEIAEAGAEKVNEIIERRAQQIEQIKAEKGIGKDAAQEIKRVSAEGQKEIDEALKGISEEKKAESIKGIAEPTEKAEQAEPVKPEEPESPANKLLRLIRYADTVETEQKKLRHKELSRRVGRVAAIQERVSGEKALIQAKAALKGQLPAAQFTPPRLGLTEADINSLHDDIRLSGKLSPLEIVSAQDGLNTIIDNGRVPQRSKLKLLERVFGKELVKALLDKRSTWEKAWSAVVDIANLPRTLLTAYDLSAAMRQTWLVAPRHPAIWTKALGSQIKAFGSAKHANSVMDSIRSSKWYDDAVQFGLYLPDPESTAEGLAERPEEFMSRLALEIPGVRASERAFITMGNKVRFELWSKYCDLWKDSKKPASAYKALAKYLNAATGRGNLGQLSKYMPMMNAAFFSPRWTVSRFQAISALSNKDVRKIVAGDLTSFVLANLALLVALKAFWGDKVEVELDPRSSDFGKVRVGNTRFDFWAGYQQLARHIAQLAAGERKTLATKEIRKASRKEVLARYARSKLAPVPAFVVDLWTGKTYTGDEMKLFSWGYWQAEPTKWEMGRDVLDQLRKRFAPLSFQDIGEAFYYQGGGAALATIPAAILGMGVGTWKVDVGTQGRLLKDELARKYYGVKWNDLGPTSQRALRIREPRIAELERRARVKGQSISYLNRIVAEQQKAAEYVRGKLAPVIRQEMKRLYIRVPALSRRSGEWTMNDKWYAEYQKLAAQEINKRLKDMVSKPDWTTRPEESRRRIIEAGISAATERARNIIRRRADQEIKK